MSQLGRAVARAVFASAAMLTVPAGGADALAITDFRIVSQTPGEVLFGATVRVGEDGPVEGLLAGVDFRFAADDPFPPPPDPPEPGPPPPSPPPDPTPRVEPLLPPSLTEQERKDIDAALKDLFEESQKQIEEDARKQLESDLQKMLDEGAEAILKEYEDRIAAEQAKIDAELDRAERELQRLRDAELKRLLAPPLKGLFRVPNRNDLQKQRERRRQLQLEQTIFSGETIELRLLLGTPALFNRFDAELTLTELRFEGDDAIGGASARALGSLAPIPLPAAAPLLAAALAFLGLLGRARSRA